MSRFKTKQEEFWAGQFGDEYINRNSEDWLLASNIALFSYILKNRGSIDSVIEFGANIGMNIKAMQTLLPKTDFDVVEINAKAVKELQKIQKIRNIFHKSILEFETKEMYDFVFTKGVLIHINPDALESVYEKMYNASSKYICMIEYYNPTPMEVPYRGNNEKMYKRDFAGEIMQKYPDLELIDYGFTYRNDPLFLHDDLTWFLMQKRR